MIAAPMSAPKRRERVPFLRFLFDPLDLDEAIEWLKGRSTESPYGYVVTPNVDHALFTEEEPSTFEPLYKDAVLCLCDSRVLSRLARACGVRLPVAPGSDLTRALFERVLQAGDRVCVVGSSDAAVQRLQTSYPEQVVERCSAPMGLRDDPAARERTAEAAVKVGRDARFYLLAVGSPQQELLARRISSVPGASGTALCIGASIDFLTGEQRRAPRALQKAGVEWAWRLLLHPRRLARRYIVVGPAVFPLAWRWARSRRRSAGLD